MKQNLWDSLYHLEVILSKFIFSTENHEFSNGNIYNVVIMGFQYINNIYISVYDHWMFRTRYVK